MKDASHLPGQRPGGAPAVPPASACGFEFLEPVREELNAQFAQRRRAGVRLSESAVLEHLRSVIGPLAHSIHHMFPERMRDVLTSLFDVSLDLFAAALLGESPRHGHVQTLWREVLGGAPQLLAREPRRLAGCLSNAVHNVALQPGTRPEVWLARMREVAPWCESAAQWLDAGKIAAWQAGMAQFRQAGLQTARRLPPVLAAAAMGISWEGSLEEWRSLLDRLDEDPWCRVESARFPPAPGPESLDCVAVVGGFRGWGGAVMRPPCVVCHEGMLIVSDGSQQWQLMADAYGSCFHPRGAAVSARPTPQPPDGVALDAKGRLQWGTLQRRFPTLAGATSIACLGMTLAVTTATSHHVYLIARRKGAA